MTQYCVVVFKKGWPFSADHALSWVIWTTLNPSISSSRSTSLIQVSFYSLDYYGRPQINEYSAGHFVIKSAEFLDAEVYAIDREIIAVGAINREIERTIDNPKNRS